jgi:hypothetical protein
MKRLDKIFLQRRYVNIRFFSILKNGEKTQNRIRNFLDTSSQPLTLTPASSSPVSPPLPSHSSNSLAALDAALSTAEKESTESSGNERISSELAEFETANPIELKRSVLQVIRDLEDRHAVHTATMQSMERSREWKDYDAHVHFELQLLRLRYSSGETSAEAMTSQRRAQMAAHLRAKQLEVMEEHATQAAAVFVNNLSESEKEQLKLSLSRIDASTAGITANAGPKTPGGSVFDDELRSALNELSLLLPAFSQPGKR